MEKIKQMLENETTKTILMVLVLILVASSSFMLGRLSKSGDSPGIKLIEPPQMQSVANATSAAAQMENLTTPTSAITAPKANISTPSQKNYFASTRGSKYYPVGCSAGKSIKQENRVYFATAADAQKAGYELSNSCK